MPQYSNSQLKKGSIGAPYTHNEYLQLFREKKWKGGFVRVSNNLTVYV